MAMSAEHRNLQAFNGNGSSGTKTPHTKKIYIDLNNFSHILFFFSCAFMASKPNCSLLKKNAKDKCFVLFDCLAMMDLYAVKSQDTINISVDSCY